MRDSHISGVPSTGKDGNAVLIEVSARADQYLAGSTGMTGLSPPDGQMRGYRYDF
jgi:hypothetical protein